MSKKTQGFSRTFAPGQGVYHGPPMVMLRKEEYDILVGIAEQAEHYLDEVSAPLTSAHGNALYVRLNALADFRRRTTSAPK